MQEAAKALVGEDRLLTTSTITQIFVSPRKRAQQTLRILNLPSSVPVSTTPLLAEWDYGDYEGISTEEIKQRRGGSWDIWKDGCPGGESPLDVQKRVDQLIGEIRGIHKRAEEEDRCGDVVVVAHAHVLRCFTARWLGLPVETGRSFLLDAGGVGVLWYGLPSSCGLIVSYEHHSFEEPAVDCWNVTDGMSRGLSGINCREGNWTDYLEACQCDFLILQTYNAYIYTYIDQIRSLCSHEIFTVP
jgi:probable phosphoglycerate mutase